MEKLPLKELHLPEAISWFPPALGWWLLLLVVPLLIAGLYVLYHYLTRKTPVKLAKQALLDIQKSSMTNQEKLAALSALLRRVAISIHARQEVASLTGMAWLAFLDSSLPDTPFSTGIGRYFLEAPYRSQELSDQKLSKLISLCEYWLSYQTS